MSRPRKIDDDEILDRSVELLWRNGLAAVSIRDLEIALDLRAPSIYRRFSSKDELIARCIDRYVDRDVGRRIRALLDADVDPLNGLRRFFVTTLRAHPGEVDARGCLLTTAAAQAHAAPPEVVQAIDRGFGIIEAALVRQIERAQNAGQVAPDLDVSAAATTLMLAFQGLLVFARHGAEGLEAGIDATLRIVVPRT